MPRPTAEDYAPFYAGYVNQVLHDDVLGEMRADLAPTLEFLRSVPESETCKLHAPYTWTFRDVLGHILDGERVFTYRALLFARGDDRPLAGFDENLFIKTGDYQRIAFAELAEEFANLRRSTIAFYHGLPAEAWERRGFASVAPVSVRALAYITLGHGRHHFAILRKRLLSAGAQA